MNDLVSVIIPLYNKEKYIESTLKSVLSQTYKNIEIIIIDDASTDNSYNNIKKYIDNDNVKYLKMSSNSGPALSRNKGIEIARGKYISFQDADDLWDSLKIEKQIKFMKEKDCAFSYTSFVYTDKDGEPITSKINIQEILTYKEALKNTRILTISAMFDMDKLKKSDIIMPDIQSEDVATWWKILKLGYVAYGLNEVLVYYRQVPNSLSCDKLKWYKTRWNLYRNYEKFSFFKSVYYFSFYVFYGFIKRM